MPPQIARQLITLSLILAWLPLLSACSTPAATQQGGGESLPPCPSKPNCVSSQSRHAEHAVQPFIGVSRDDWQGLKQQVAKLPRLKIVSSNSRYLHAVQRSKLVGFKDDIELLYHAEEQRVDIRSASRLGHYDFGVNRQRVYELHRKFKRYLESTSPLKRGASTEKQTH